MRKPRDFDSELKALEEKARTLRARKVQQLGELAVACGTDALTIEQLAGALLEAAEANQTTKEAWRRNRCSGATLFDFVARAEVRGWTTPRLRPHWTPALECL